MRSPDFFSTCNLASPPPRTYSIRSVSGAHRTPHSIRPADGDEPTVCRGSVRGERDRVHTSKRALASSLLSALVSSILPRRGLTSRPASCSRLRSCGVAVGVNRGRPGPVPWTGGLRTERSHHGDPARARRNTLRCSAAADPIRSPIRPRAH